MRTSIVPLFLLLCLILGGASAAGYMANAVLQITALALIAAVLLTRRPILLPPSGRQLIGLTLLALALPIVQLLPLPPGVWTALSGRSELEGVLRMLGLDPTWLPLSLTPHDTIASLLWLLPALAILLGILRMGAYRPAAIGWVLAGASCAGILLGALQLTGGAQSPWYIYRITNYGLATGFFANGNHFATLLLATIPFVAALFARHQHRSSRERGGVTAALAGIAIILMTGLVINGSLAGIGLAVPVITASVLLVIGARRSSPSWPIALIAVAALGSVVLTFNAPLGEALLSDQVGASQSSREAIFGTTWRAALHFFPAGSGIGSFAEIYRLFEDPAAVTNEYINHAHSDFLELLLEAGLAGVVLVAVFLFWWSTRAIVLWRTPEHDVFARAATIASAAILVHSLVDYPLRTAAISAVFAACCALMAQPRPKQRRRPAEAKESSTVRHLSAD